MNHQLVAPHTSDPIKSILGEDFMLDLCREVIRRSEEASGPGQVHHKRAALNWFPHRSITAHDVKQRFLRGVDARGIRGEYVQGATDPSGLLDGHADRKTSLFSFE